MVGHVEDSVGIVEDLGEVVRVGRDTVPQDTDRKGHAGVGSGWGADVGDTAVD